MNYSRFYARLMGFYLVIMSAGIVLKPSIFERMLAVSQNPANMLVFGIFALFLGLTVVITHSVWKSWPLLITLLGYWIILKAVVLLFFPDIALQMMSKFTHANPLVPGLIDMALGVVLLVLGFMRR